MEHARRAAAQPNAELAKPPMIPWPRELLQARAADVVLAAALCKPNALGSHELTSATGFGQRQILKARGVYLAERVVLGVTPLHVLALEPHFGHRAARSLGCWPRGSVRALPTDAVGDRAEPAWPAIILADDHWKLLAELQVIECDDDAWRLLAMLLQCVPS